MHKLMLIRCVSIALLMALCSGAFIACGKYNANERLSSGYANDLQQASRYFSMASSEEKPSQKDTIHNLLHVALEKDINVIKDAAKKFSERAGGDNAVGPTLTLLNGLVYEHECENNLECYGPFILNNKNLSIPKGYGYMGAFFSYDSSFGRNVSLRVRGKNQLAELTAD